MLLALLWITHGCILNPARRTSAIPASRIENDIFMPKFCRKCRFLYVSREKPALIARIPSQIPPAAAQQVTVVGMTEHSPNPARPANQRDDQRNGQQRNQGSSQGGQDTQRNQGSSQGGQDTQRNQGSERQGSNLQHSQGNQAGARRRGRQRRRNRRRVERGVTTTHLTIESSLGAASTSLADANLHKHTPNVDEQSLTAREAREQDSQQDSQRSHQRASQQDPQQEPKQQTQQTPQQTQEPKQQTQQTPPQAQQIPQQQAKQHAQFSSPEVAPYVFVAIQTNGIHPSTARLLSLGVSTTDDEGNIVDTWHVVVDPKEDPGPQHLHGLTSDDFLGAPQFGIILSKLTYALDGRTLVTHDAPRVWGFIMSEAKRARRQANRENRKNRGRRRHGRARVGRIPAPSLVIDTLATARRQGTPLPDTRLRGVARAYGLDVPSPVASLEGRAVPEHDRTLHDVTTTLALFTAQGGFGAERQGANALGANRASALGANTASVSRASALGANALGASTIAAMKPEDLKADSVGLQRSAVRVAAIEAPRPVENPGTYQRGKNLQEGMEFAVAPEVLADPDELISAGVAAGLVYSEKVTRKTSLLVCNQPADVTSDQLVGKAMHAHRKEIPLVSDEAFLQLVESAQ